MLYTTINIICVGAKNLECTEKYFQHVPRERKRGREREREKREREREREEREREREAGRSAVFRQAS